MVSPNRPILFACDFHEGQINSLLAIVTELSRRGVPDLCFVAGSRFQADIEAAATNSKIDFFPVEEFAERWVGELDIERCTVAQRGKAMRATLVEFARRYFDLARGADGYQQMLDIIDSLNPVCMVVDILNYPAIDAAMTCGTPFALTVPALPSTAARKPWSYPSPMSDLPRRMNIVQHASNVLRKLRTVIAIVTRTPISEFSKKRKAMGIKNFRAALGGYVDAATLVLTSSVFGLEYEFPVPPQVNLVGAFVSEASTGGVEDSDLSQWLNDNASVIYMGFGTVLGLSHGQITALLGVIEQLGPEHKFLWKLSAAQQKLLPAYPELPRNLRLEDWLPSQLDVLAHPHVRAFVTHGGSNGFHESIYFGKPVLVIPAWGDCYAIARRAIDSGVGLAVRRPLKVTSDELTDKLTRLLTDDTFKQRAEYWSARVREAGGTSRAADLVLEMDTQSRQ